MEKQFEGKFKKEAMRPGHPHWEDAIRRSQEIYIRPDEVRSPFTRDYTRVLHSLAYRRLKHKTQVFYNAAGNDHICTRIEHVSHVSSVADTIAIRLGLNQELTKAIALSHDLGHAPFGHNGEAIIRKLTEKYLQEDFWHEKNGVYFVDEIELLEDTEKVLRNLNLTYAVRDGIISHCGELDENGLMPRKEWIDLKDFTTPGQYNAATWEGCVVKLADKIAYLGRDIEDAERLGYFTREHQQMLREMVHISNEKAVNTTVITHNMIIDLCENSSPEKGIALSEEMQEQMTMIKRFNAEHIYTSPRLTPYQEYSKLVLNQIFEVLRAYYDGENTIRRIDKMKYEKRKFVKDFAMWIAQYVEPDLLEGIEWAEEVTAFCGNKKIYGRLEEERKYLRAIIDFLAGMTDNYAVGCFEELLQC